MPLDEPEGSLATIVETLDVDSNTLHEILADPRRRYTLARLNEVLDPIHLCDLADDIAAWEREQGTGDADEPERIHQSLYHVHVAKMTDAGLVDYDSTRDTVLLADKGYVLAAHLPPTGTAGVPTRGGQPDGERQ